MRHRFTRILHFTERGHSGEGGGPGSETHVYSYAPPFFSVYVQKISTEIATGVEHVLDFEVFSPAPISL